MQFLVLSDSRLTMLRPLLWAGKCHTMLRCLRMADERHTMLEFLLLAKTRHTTPQLLLLSDSQQIVLRLLLLSSSQDSSRGARTSGQPKSTYILAALLARTITMPITM
jgi:hypothetical protein